LPISKIDVVVIVHIPARSLPAPIRLSHLSLRSSPIYRHIPPGVAEGSLMSLRSSPIYRHIPPGVAEGCLIPSIPGVVGVAITSTIVAIGVYVMHASRAQSVSRAVC
jgi:hypothetical protein